MARGLVALFINTMAFDRRRTLFRKEKEDMPRVPLPCPPGMPPATRQLSCAMAAMAIRGAAAEIPISE